MTGSQSRRSIALDPDALGDAETLLERYPDVSSSERDRVAHFLRRGAPIDIGLLSSNAELWATAERFKRDNPHYFKVGVRVYIGWAGALTAIIGTLVLIKDAGVN